MQSNRWDAWWRHFAVTMLWRSNSFLILSSWTTDPILDLIVEMQDMMVVCERCGDGWLARFREKMICAPCYCWVITRLDWWSLAKNNQTKWSWVITGLDWWSLAKNNQTKWSEVWVLWLSQHEVSDHQKAVSQQWSLTPTTPTLVCYMLHSEYATLRLLLWHVVASWHPAAHSDHRDAVTVSDVGTVLNAEQKIQVGQWNQWHEGPFWQTCE